MARRSKGRGRGYSRRAGSTRRSYGRSSSPRRGVSRRGGSARQQTVRIVLESPGAQPLAGSVQQIAAARRLAGVTAGKVEHPMQKFRSNQKL